MVVNLGSSSGAWLLQSSSKFFFSIHAPFYKKISLSLCPRCPLLNLSEYQTLCRPMIQIMQSFSAGCLTATQFSPFSRFNTKPSYWGFVLHSVDESEREIRAYWVSTCHTSQKIYIFAIKMINQIDMLYGNVIIFLFKSGFAFLTSRCEKKKVGIITFPYKISTSYY